MADDRPRRPPRLRQRAEELFHQVPEGHDLVDQAVVARQADVVVLPQDVLDLGQAVENTTGVQENGPWLAGDEPPAVVGVEPALAQGLDGRAHRARGRRPLEFQGAILRTVRPDHRVPVAPALGHAGDLRADHRVDAAQLLADLPGDLAEEGLGGRRRGGDRRPGSGTALGGRLLGPGHARNVAGRRGFVQSNVWDGRTCLPEPAFAVDLLREW